VLLTSIIDIIIAIDFGDDHGLAAARTGILGAQPCLDARLVEPIVLAAVPATCHNGVSGVCVGGVKFLETNSAADSFIVTVTATITATSCYSRSSLVNFNCHQGLLDATVQIQLQGVADSRKVVCDTGLDQDYTHGALDQDHQR